MFKNKKISLFAGLVAFLFVASFGASAIAKADDGLGTTHTDNSTATQEVGQGHSDNNSSTVIATSGQENENEHASSEVENATGSENENHATTTGQLNAKEHRSVVANFVHSLLDVANREPGGIGQQVRTIAQEQSQSASTTEQAIQKVQSRSKLMTFLIGSDYKSLGVLRSEMVTTQNQINQLNNLVPSLQNASDTQAVQNQIQSLQQQQTQINNFIQTQESQFSLFGWLAKLFNK